MDRRPLSDALMTTAVLLRSRMMGNYQVRFWRATALVRESLTLIWNGARNIMIRAMSATTTKFSFGAVQILPANAQV